MDLTQQKLTKSEWEYLEVPVNIEELEILRLIYNSYESVDYTFNKTKSLLGFMKISGDDKEFHLNLYERYFKKIMDKLIKVYDLKFVIDKKMKTTKKIKTADLIRINNSSKKLKDIKNNIYEFIILSNITKFFKKNYCPQRYYTLTQLLKNNISHLNIIVKSFVEYIIKTYESKIDKILLVKNAYS